MAQNSNQLNDSDYFPEEVYRRDDVFGLYGRWNALVAETPDRQRLGWIPAHDGDFFPESPLDHVEALRAAMLHGDDERLQGVWPVRVDVDITQQCNCRCLFCYSRQYRADNHYKDYWISLETFASLVQELSNRRTRCVRLTVGGEPFLHPKIHRILPLMKNFGLRTCVLTNGDLLDEKKIELVFNNVDHLRWSVNANSDEMRIQLHRSVSGANPLSRTISLVESLITRRNRERIGQRRPNIWATFILHPYNIGEIVSSARTLQNIGIDSISFRPAYHGLGGSWTRDDKKKLARSLNEVKKLHNPPAFSVFVPKRKSTEVGQLKPSNYFPFCLSRRLRTVLEVCSTGLAVQTCGLWRGSGLHNKQVVNDKTSFNDAWNTALHEGPPSEAPKNCENCIDVSMNATVNLIWQILEKNPDAVFHKARLTGCNSSSIKNSSIQKYPEASPE
jgi:MoaA/NifB/PqqE/SkfB family radical SAM enzyme